MLILLKIYVVPVGAGGLTKIPNKEVFAMPTGTSIPKKPPTSPPSSPFFRRQRRRRRRETSAKEIFPISTAFLKEIFLTRTECVMYDENDDRINTPVELNGETRALPVSSLLRAKLLYLSSLYRTGFLFGESPR